MPIRAENMGRYPGGSIRSATWKAIRSRSLTRAGNRCEGTPMRPHCRVVNGQPRPDKPKTKIVLTVAHMDDDLVDHSDENLKALCQACHLEWGRRVRELRESRIPAQIDFPFGSAP